MRIIVGILILVASITAAAAQTPYGAAAPAPSTAAPPAAPAAAPAPAAPVAPAPVAAAPAAPLYPPGSVSFYVNGASIIAAAPARSPEQQKADQASQVAWQERCRPTIDEDREGIRKVRYAAADCDLSPFNTVGGK